MSIALCLALFSPLLSFLFQVAASRYLSRKLTGYIASTAILLSFTLCSFLLFTYLQTGKYPLDVELFRWIPVDGIDASFKLHLDSLSLLMTMIITGVGFLIHVYSIGYMDHEKDYVRYFACLNLFVFAMLLLVLASNLLLLFVGWEGVGLASYLLIGYDYYRPKAAEAATKAFVVNRIGDFGFLLGLLFIFSVFGTSDIATIKAGAANTSSGTLTIIALLLFVGACGKSAQLPLHVWLADAMEGPTPVSALIHAATMVTAGVYLVVRMHVLFLGAPIALDVVGIIGALTALFAALAALGQTDLKRVLAYSTVSQLGYMFLACGVQAFYAAMFHLTTHAFIKALLFLSAGNIVHMMHGTTDMREMGGLAKIFKKTHWLFLIGVLAMSGIPPLAAFFSKDLILEEADVTHHEGLFLIGLIAAVLTAFYLMRAYCLTFLGPSRWKEKNPEARISEAPKIMVAPCALLALLSIFGGTLGLALGGTPPLLHFLVGMGISPTEYELGSHFHFSISMVLATFGGLIGLVVSAFIYLRYYEKLGKTWTFLTQAFYVDNLYGFLFVRPLKAISKCFAMFFEPVIFEGSIDKLSQGTKKLAKSLQKIQSGQIRSYAAWMTLGAAFLMVYMLSKIG